MADDSYVEGETLISRHGRSRFDRDSDDDGEFQQIELEGEQHGHFTDASTAGPAPSPRQANCFVFMASIMASLGGVLFGYDIGIISGAILQLRDVFCLSCLDQELVVSAMLIGAVFGSLVGGFVIDHFGRRVTIIGNSVVFLVGALILGFAPNFPILVIGRVLVGFAVSVSATGECIYISEIAPAKSRGLLVSLNELGITLGLLLAYLCNFLFINTPNGWRWMFVLSAIPAVVQGVGMYFLPPSPRFLMIKKQEEKAEQVLKKLRGTSMVDQEISGIRVSLASEKNQSCLDLCSLQDGMRGRMVVGIGLVFFQQFTGQPNVLYYAPTIFEEIGFHSDSAATLATVGLGVIKLLMTIIALCLVDKIGRRKFLLTGAFLMGLSILMLGIVCRFQDSGPPVNPCLDHSACNNANISDFNHHADSHNILPTPDSLTTHILHSSIDNKHINNSIYNSSGHVTQQTVIPNNSLNLKNISTTPAGGKNNSSAVEEHSSSSLHRLLGFLSLMTYVAAYGFGFGPVTWLVLSEIYPAAVKGRAIALATVFNWGTNLIVTFTFLDLMKGIGVSWTFVLFSLICAMSVVFIFSFVPETKNKTLEQVSADMKQRISIRPPCMRMKQNCRGLLCCISSQTALRINSSYSRVESETVT